MKILYFAPHPLWPLTTGARLRDFHCARQLALHAEVTFVQLCAPEEASLPPEAGSIRVCSVFKGKSYTPDKILRGLLGPVPLTVLNYYSSQAAAQLADILTCHGPFDSVQIEGVHLSSYLPLLRAATGNPPIIADWHNIESELMRRYGESESNPLKSIVARRTAYLLEGSEKLLMADCAAHTVASDREREIIRQRFPKAIIRVIPNAVDAQFYAHPPGQRKLQSLLFAGSMDYHANIDAVLWFASNVWPAIARRDPDLMFTIMGRNPNAAVKALAGPRIRVTGTVDDVRPYYRNAFAAVVPLRVGSGTRLKILEAMAAGVPVVSTRLGAEGIDIRHEQHILLADTPDEIAAAVLRLRDEPEMISRLVDSARQLVLQMYEWSVVGTLLYDLHLELIKKKGPVI